MKIKNTKESTLCIPNFPAFGPGEVRECTKQEAEILLANPFIVVSEASGDAVVSRGKASTKNPPEKK